MRASLFYNPLDVVERLAVASRNFRRRRRLRGTPAEALELGHIDSLELLELLKERPPRAVHDIGANVGTWTCLAKSLYPAASVDAFEPLELHESGFARNTSRLSDVRLHKLALGPTDGFAEVEVMDFSDASSILPISDTGRKAFNVTPRERHKVPLATLDGLVATGTARMPDLIKLDVQGYELEVLKGAPRVLKSVGAIICEVSFHRFYEGQPLFPDVLSFLGSAGFTLKAFGTSLVPGQPLSQADALFVRN